MLPLGVAVAGAGVFVAAAGVFVAVAGVVAGGVFVAVAGALVGELVEAGVDVAAAVQRAVPVRWSALQANDRGEPLAQRTVSPLLRVINAAALTRCSASLIATGSHTVDCA